MDVCVVITRRPELQPREALKKELAGAPTPMFGEIRELIVRKCVPDKQKQVSEIFEKQPFGELERLVTQRLLDVIKKVVNEELSSERWLHLVSRLSGRSYEQYTRYRAEVSGHGYLEFVAGKLCFLPVATDSILGRLSNDFRDGDYLKSENRIGRSQKV